MIIACSSSRLRRSRASPPRRSTGSPSAGDAPPAPREFCQAFQARAPTPARSPYLSAFPPSLRPRREPTSSPRAPPPSRLLTSSPEPPPCPAAPSPPPPSWRERPSSMPLISRPGPPWLRSEEHTSELQSRPHLVCRLLL